MAGLDDLKADSNDRWAKAERYARGYADNGMGEALRIYYTRYFPIGVFIVIALVIAFGPLLFPDEPTDWLFTAQLGITVLGMFSLVGGLVYNAKRFRSRVELGSNLAIVFPLEKEEQKYLRRVINGKEPVPDKHLQVARAVAVQTRKGLATALLVAPMYSYTIGLAIGQLNWLYLLLVALFAGTTIVQVRDFRRQGRFLQTTSP